MNFANARRKVIEALATGFYLGKIPFMPGTWGTLLGLPAVWLLVKAGPVPYLLLTIVFVLASSAVAEYHERYTKAHDPGEIVIDEVVGFVIAMTWLPQTWQAYLGAFVVFRFFDILKPPPIRQIDQRIHGGLGTVLDDVAAGLITNIILQVVYTQTAWLGERFGG